MEDAVLHERVGRPGLKVGAELASVAKGVAVLLEILDGDGRAEEEEGLGRFEVGFGGTDRERSPPIEGPAL